MKKNQKNIDKNIAISKTEVRFIRWRIWKEGKEKLLRRKEVDSFVWQGKQMWGGGGHVNNLYIFHIRGFLNVAIRNVGIQIDRQIDLFGYIYRLQWCHVIKKLQLTILYIIGS